MEFKKHILICLGFIFLFIIQNPLRCQTIETIKADSKTYLFGTGNGTTIQAADQKAFTELLGQISAQIEVNFKSDEQENKIISKETINLIARTYFNSISKNTNRIIVQDEPSAIVFRYIKRTELNKAIRARRDKLIEFAHNGEIALKNFQVADALRSFYWSQTLLRSVPEFRTVKMKTEDGTEVQPITWLPKQIEHTLANISIKIDSVEKNGSNVIYNLDIQYQKNPVNNFDYSYWNGQDWSKTISAKDGIGFIELPNSENKETVRIKAEYIFEEESNIDLELRDVLQTLPLVPYNSSYFTITKTKILSTEVRNLGGKAKDALNSGNLHPLSGMEEYNSVMKKVTSAIASNDYSSVQSFFTAEGYSVFKNLLQYGKSRILKINELKYFQYGDYIVCRSIPMSFNFESNNRTFIEDVVFYFNNEDKICNISFGLSSKSIEDIASNDSWSPENRLLLMCFLENYKTAFALKRYEYINKIFSDDALIITGYVTKVNTTEDNPALNNTIVKYNRQSKADYMKRLKLSFESNEFINIKFFDNNIRRSGKGNDIYGIQIKQDYFSTNYGDTGYLFLLVDLTNIKIPQIHIRTWQPQKNPDGSIYGLSDF